MTITKKINMDLLQSGPAATVEAVQADNCSRCLEFSLHVAGKPFRIPDHTSALIRYRKMDKTGGEYDTLPNGAPAWGISRNRVTITLAPQALTFPGIVDLSVTLICDGKQLTTFPVCVDVKPAAHVQTAESQNYFYVTSILSAPVNAQAGEFLRVSAVNSQGLVTAVETVPLDSITGDADSEQVYNLVEQYLEENPPQGKPGEDGISATHSWDGTVLTVSSASGTSSADLKGEKGDAGASGATGKSAYETAQDGGYLGTEEEFAQKLAVEYIDWFGKGVSIPSGSDLNTYETAGKYYAQSESTAQSLANCPTTTNFVMFVFMRTSNVYSQLIITLSGKMYIRSSSTSAWRAWVAYTTSEEITELTDSVKQEIADGLNIPTRTSELTNDSGFLTAEDIPETGEYIDWFGVGISIPSGSNLNTYSTPGKYYAASESIAQSLSNCPTATNFVMFVFDRTGGIYSQLIITLHGTMHLRSANSSAWRSWITYTTSSDLEDTVDTKLQEAKDSGEFDGADGYTPVKGVDYWTQEDQESIVQQVITALGTPVFGTVDDENNIILTGDLADGTYTLKYEGSDGSKVDIGSFEVGVMINQIPISTDETGAVFNAVGYQSGYRISSSGEVKAFDGQSITGFIPCVSGDLVRFTADMFNADDTTTAGYNAIAAYTADRIFIQNVYVPNSDQGGISQESDTVWVFAPGDISSLAEIGYIRFCLNTITADSIVTVNQELS